MTKACFLLMLHVHCALLCWRPGQRERCHDIAPAGSYRHSSWMAMTDIRRGREAVWENNTADYHRLHQRGGFDLIRL